MLQISTSVPLTMAQVIAQTVLLVSTHMDRSSVIVHLDGKEDCAWQVCVKIMIQFGVGEVGD